MKDLRIDLPRCGFKNCRFQADGNCVNESEYSRCNHVKMEGTINSIIKAYNICCLCQNTMCEKDDVCVPICNGQHFGAI